MNAIAARLRAAFAAAAVGAVVGLLDCLRSTLGLGAGFDADRYPVSVLWYAAAGAVVGLVLARPRFRPEASAVALGLAVGLSALFPAPPPEPAAAVPTPRSAGTAPRPVLLLVVDTLRADHTSLHGYDRDTTPNLARFAEDALVFDAAYSTSSWTKPAMASMMTGLPPGVHGQEDFRDVLAPAALTVAESLRAGGHATALFSDNVLVSPATRFDQGFDHVYTIVSLDDHPYRLPDATALGWLLGKVPFARRGVQPAEPELLVEDEDGAPVLNGAFLDWLDGLPPDRPWFAHVHYMEPHWYYEAPEGWRDRYAPQPEVLPDLVTLDQGLAPFREGDPRLNEWAQALIDAYDAEIAFWDHCFGELLAELEARGILDEITIVVVSDHGEAFGDHGTWEHRTSLHDEQVRVPLAIRTPGGPRGRVAESFSTMALAPTLHRLAGFVPPEEMVRFTGSLIPRPERTAPCYLRVKEDGALITGIVEDGRKWIFGRLDGEEVLQCFDLAADPGETTDLLSGARPAVEAAARIRERLLRRAKAHEPFAATLAETRELSPAARAALRTMGYLK